MPDVACLCTEHCTPPGETECLEACWSEGRSCAGCHRDDCYRQGWEADRVAKDNAKRVREHGGMVGEYIEPPPIPRKFDPYGDVKQYHMADKMNGRGDVSALCYKQLRPIRLGRWQWTLDPAAVTCKRCLKLLGRASHA